MEMLSFLGGLWAAHMEQPWRWLRKDGDGCRVLMAALFGAVVEVASLIEIRGSVRVVV